MIKLCNDGVTRIVFLIGSYAVKIPRFNYSWSNFLRGLLCNMQETIFSATNWPELCPVKFSIAGGWLIVMDRAEPLTDEQWDSFDFDNFQLGREWSEEKLYPGHYCGDYFVPVENKRDSFGVLNGHIVAVDYGS